ncbi:MAG TPA: DUF3461 family protein [Leucothrix mucor]|nr:DUF3461 family protein [Leucothrix mucor]
MTANLLHRTIVMSDFPTLLEMDINRFDEITHYSLRPNGKAGDILKIYYKRKKGSVLPERKTFKFGRSAKMIADKNAQNGSVEIFEISPFLLKAMSELDGIVGKRHKEKDLTELLLKRVDQIEKDIKASTDELRSIIKSLKETL